VSYLKGGLESWINEERGLEAPGSIPLP
jgi:hypothetical protein